MTPIEKMLNEVAWVHVNIAPAGTDLPFVTHEGVMTIGEFRLRVYQLNTGERVIDADDVERFFGGITNEDTPP